MLSLAEFQKLAQEKGGKCLSKDYLGINHKLEFVCASGHFFKLSGTAIKHQSRWCQECSLAEKKLSVEDISKLATDRGGGCSDAATYKDINSILTWVCATGHIFKNKVYNIKFNNSWCPACPRNRKKKPTKLSYDQVVEKAKERGGRLLSPEYKGTFFEHMWECEKKHIWSAKASAILYFGNWCPYCNISKSEEICRSYFEQLFGKSFPPATTEWLRNENGHHLYLDGYCKELQIAFEHQGMQHYKEIPFFKNKLDKQKAHDALKEQLCPLNGVTLVVIPALFKTTALKDLKPLIRLKCLKKLSDNFDKIEPILGNLTDLKHQSCLSECKKVAAQKGGKCLSISYLNAFEYMEWECSKGHQWTTTFETIRRGYWCPQCSYDRKKKYSLDICQKIAILNGGKCLTDSYVDVNSVISLECAVGHQWKTQARNLFYGSWCITCKGPRSKNMTVKKFLQLYEGNIC